MKQHAKLLLVIAIVFVFAMCFVACDSLEASMLDLGTLYLEDGLPGSASFTTDGTLSGTEVSGTFAWTEGQTVEEGEKEYSYTFTSTDGKEITGTVKLTFHKATAVQVSTLPQKTTYTEGDTFDATGMVVTVKYDNGDEITRTVTNYTYAPTGELTSDDTTVTVTYSGLVDTFQITVNKAETPVTPHTHTYNFKEWKNGTKPTTETGATAVMTCACGDETEETVATLSDTTVWTKDTTKSVASTHTVAGKDVYTSTKYGEVEVAIAMTAHTYTFKEWKNGTKPTTETGATAVMTCACGDETEETVATLSDTTVWTVDSSKSTPASYNSGSVTVYTSTKYGEVAVTGADKLAAVYEGKKYSVQLCYGNNNTFIANLDGTSYILEIDATGKAIDTIYHSDTNYNKDAKLSFTLVDGTQPYGEIIVTSTYKEEDSSTEMTEIHYGYVDAKGNIIFARGEDTKNCATSQFICTPSDTALTKDNYKTCYAWYNNSRKAISVIVDNVRFNIYSTNEKVYTGVSFVDINGNAINAEDITSTGGNAKVDYVAVLSSDGTKIETFAKSGETFDLADGNEGVYTNGTDTLTVYGNGLFSYTNADGTQTQTGEYSENGNGFDAYIVESGNRVAYYYLTLDSEAKTFTLEVRKATVSYNVGEFAAAVPSEEVSINIPFTLPTTVTVTDSTKTFVGWYRDSAFTEKVGETLTLTSTDAVTIYAKIDNKTVITVVDSMRGNSTVYGAASQELGEVLPNNVVNTFYGDGSQYFVGWCSDSAMEETLDTENTVGTNALTVYAKYSYSNWSFTLGDTYTFVYDSTDKTWKSNNQGKNSTKATMTITAVGGPVQVSFDYWCSSENATMYDYLTVAYYESGSSKSVKAGGKTTTSADKKSISTVLQEGETVVFTYQKDGGTDGGSDTAYILNLKINGAAVISTNGPTSISGTYTSEGADTIKLDNISTITKGSEVGTYEEVEGETYQAIAYIGGKTYKLTLTGSTYTLDEYKVTISFNLGTTGATLAEQQAYYGSTFDLTTVTAPTVTGYTFRNWSSQSDLSDTITSFTAESNTTVYAKYDAAVTVTYVYNDDTTANTTDTLFVGDTLESVPTVTTTVEGKVFVGWYKENGSGYTTEYVAGTEITESITLYARWETPSDFMNSYKIAKIVGVGNTLYDSAFTNTAVEVAWDGISAKSSALGNNNATYTLTWKDKSKGLVLLTENYGSSSTEYHLGYLDSTSGIMVFNDGLYTEPTAWSSTNTIFVVIPTDTDLTTTNFKYYGFAVDPGYKYNKLFSYGDTNYYVGESGVFSGVTVQALDYTDISTKSAEIGKSVADMSSNVLSFRIYKDADMLLEVGEKTSGTRYSLLDGKQGNYNASNVYVTLDGVGYVTLKDNTGTAKENEINGTYTLVEGSTDTYELKFTKSTYTFTISADGTPTIDALKITITLVGLDQTTDKQTVSQFKYVTYTFTNADEKAGYIFRAWYENADFSGNTVTSYNSNADKTFYAKYDAAVTVTFDYNGQGTAAASVSGKYVNDKLSASEIPTVELTYGDKVFAGWFTQNGTDGNYGDAVTTSTVLTETTTFYAKWVVPAKSAGTYKGFEVWSADSGREATSFGSTVTIDAVGTYEGERSISGSLSESDMLVEKGAINLSRYAYVTNDFGGIVIYGYSSSASSVGTDYYILFKNHANITSVAYSAKKLNEIYTSWLTVTYTESGETKTYNIFIYKDIIYTNVSWTDGITAKQCASADSVVVYDSTGTAFIKKSGSAMVGNDGKAGTYTSTDAYGDLTLDGYGTLTAGEKSAAYTLDGSTITFVLDNAMRKVTLSNGTYTKASDGFAGTYTLPDSTTLTLDGYGNVTDTTKTYVVNGTNITIYDGSASTTYGLDQENNAFLGKSKFAGLTFTCSGKSYKITFADDSSIVGELATTSNPQYKYGFTGSLDGDTLTITITSQNYSMGFVGKTITATVSTGQLAFTSSFKPDNVTEINGSTATCADFVA